MNEAIICKNLVKKFGNLKAIDDVELEISKDKIYGLIGRNGAGKTTLLHLITGQYLRDSGEVRVLGDEVFENRKVLDSICFIKEGEHPLKDYKVKDIFGAAEVFYDNWDDDFKQRLIEEFELDVKKKYKNLSRGMKSSVSNIIGLASRSPITIFDEPSLGLDAAMRDKFYNILLEDYQLHKRTIILSTHLIDEVSNLFEEVIIMNKGKILLQESVEKLMEGAYYLTGSNKDLKNFINNKRVIHRESFGNTDIIAVLERLTKDEKSELSRLNVKVSKIPLQKLFIYLTESNKGGNSYGN